jgi:hypothetical protein
VGNVELAVSSRHPDWSRPRVGEHATKYLALVHLDAGAMKKPAQHWRGMKPTGRHDHVCYRRGMEVTVWFALRDGKAFILQCPSRQRVKRRNGSSISSPRGAIASAPAMWAAPFTGRMRSKGCA